MEAFTNLISTYENSPITVTTIWSVLIASAILAIYEFIVYRFVSHRAFYNKSFNIALAILPFFISTIILCLQSNVVITLGTIGALAIIRFRTAVKDPLDTAYMFWALTMGILIGAGQYILAAITVAAIGALIFLLRHLTSKGADSYLLVMRLSQSAESSASQLMRQLKYMKLKSKTITGNGVEATYEVRVEKTEAFLNKLLSINGVHEASLIAYQSETV